MRHILGLLLITLPGCTLYFGTDDDPSPSVPDAGSGSGSGSNSIDAGSGGTHRMFVTSATYQGGSLGGPLGANTICQQHATAAGLGGHWRAWLAGVGSYPNNTMVRDNGDYVLVDGTLVAHGWDDLVDGEIWHPIDINEDNTHHQASPSCMLAIAVWSNVDFDGNPINVPEQDYSCGGWQSLSGHGILGNVEQTDTQWTHYGCAIPCTGRAALYCVEQ